MRIKNRIKKRLGKVNAFLKSRRKPTVKAIHILRLEVKHLEAFTELMAMQNNFGAKPEIPGRLEKLFQEAGKLRKLGLETKAIRSITDLNKLIKPTLFLKRLRSYEKKSSRRLRKKQKGYTAFKIRDIVKHPGVWLSSATCKQFLSARASSILDLLNQDIISDIRSLHQLRKILKSIIYVMPLCNKGVKPVQSFLKTRKKFLQAVESKIGSLHDTGLFINWMEKRHELIETSEAPALKKIKREWHHDIRAMKKNLQPLLPAVRQFAVDLKDQTVVNLSAVKMTVN
ncbi:MAG TPA: CHAD domain-containing protein [Puia sp.]|nr:CHAD domain-containing protein [Puia sp.]